jgi:hypothetical protein
MRFRRALSALVVTMVSASGLTVVVDVATAPGADAAVVKKRLVKMARELKVAREVRRGYDRSKFTHWTDDDADGCNARYEVLIAEARVKPALGSGCSLTGGRWFSYYDGQRTQNPSSFDVDHMVPLAEAWDSGARRWNAGTRKRFANDLGDKRSLVAVTASSNRSKSDRDPGDWLPRKGAHCRYVREYVAVKTRWRLTVDRPEKRALLRTARGCRNVVVKVRPAKVVARAGGGAGGSTGGDAKTGTTDPRVSYCYQAKDAGYGPEYDWYTDGDSDGVVCE